MVDGMADDIYLIFLPSHAIHGHPEIGEIESHGDDKGIAVVVLDDLMN